MHCHTDTSHCGISSLDGGAGCHFVPLFKIMCRKEISPRPTPDVAEAAGQVLTKQPSQCLFQTHAAMLCSHHLPPPALIQLSFQIIHPLVPFILASFRSSRLPFSPRFIQQLIYIGATSFTPPMVCFPACEPIHHLLSRSLSTDA